MDDPRVREGLRLLRARQWYAAHEALEEAWRDAEGEERSVLQGIIHVAVCFEHLRRGNERGALSQWRKADARLAGRAHRFGIDVTSWVIALRAFIKRIDLEGRVVHPGDPLPEQRAWPLP
jgi:predicted metal-dependent hydrolase